MNTDVKSFDGNRHVCRGCNTKLTKDKVPCQAFYNSLEIDDMPVILVCLNRLELFFIIVMAKGQYPKPPS